MNIDDLIKNGSFCAIPWVSLMVNTNSQIRFCCIASGSDAYPKDQNNKPFIAGQTQLNDVWHSESMKNIRSAMINGEKLNACSNCYHQESIGKESYRQMMTREWINKIGKEEFTSLIQDSIDSEHKNIPPIVYLDLRLGNLCNLKCRMCSPFNSSQMAKEHFNLWDKEEYKSIWQGQWGKNPEYLKNDQNWVESNFLWNELIGMIPNLKKVYMTGGEPTMIANNYRFMQECISANAADQIELFFNTNCTNVTEKFVDQLSKFKTVFLNASIDGIGLVNDYIRFPSKWDKIKTNFEKLAQLPNCIINITPVVQVYNVCDLYNLLLFAEDIGNKYNKDIGVDFLINRHPNYFDITILPDDIRKQSANQLREYRNTSLRYNQNYLIKNSIDGIINLLEGPRATNWQKLIVDFLNITKIYDESREQNFESCLSDVYRSIKNDI
jgi:MoaA/NifB/PqqE/SkfB family radical SAM enzyme